MTLTLRTSNRPDAGTQAGLSPASGLSAGQPAQSVTVVTEPDTTNTAPGSRPPALPSSLSTVSISAPTAARSTDPSAPWPVASQPSSSAPAAPVVADSRVGRAESQLWSEAPAAVSIPGPVRSPLRAAVPPPQAEELKLILPRAVADRLEQMERRLEKLERPPASVSPSEPRQASSARTP